jgi:hypothetical protein
MIGSAERSITRNVRLPPVAGRPPSSAPVKPADVDKGAAVKSVEEMEQLKKLREQGVSFCQIEEKLGLSEKLGTWRRGRESAPTGD